MSVAKFAERFFTLELDSIEDPNSLVVENCGEIEPQLEGVYLVFRKQYLDRLVSYMSKGDQDVAKSFKERFEKEPLVLLKSMADMERTTYTEALMGWYSGLAKNVFSAFGKVMVNKEERPLLNLKVKPPVEEVELEEEKIKPYDFIAEEGKDELEGKVLKEENSVSSSLDDKDELILEEPINQLIDEPSTESVLDLAGETPLELDEAELEEETEVEQEIEVEEPLVAEENETTKEVEPISTSYEYNTVPADEELELEDALTETYEESRPIVKVFDSNKQSPVEVKRTVAETNLTEKLSSEDEKRAEVAVRSTGDNVLEVTEALLIRTFGNDLDKFNATRAEFRKFFEAMTGKRYLDDKDLLTDESFSTMIETLKKMQQDSLSKAMIVVMERFWRFGEVELISRFSNELIQYLEERYL